MITLYNIFLVLSLCSSMMELYIMHIAKFFLTFW
jgi:hypothetical protein